MHIIHHYIIILFVSQKPRETRCIARTFAPDYNHHFEIDCPVLSHDEDDIPSCLAAHLAAGEILLEVWHRYGRLSVFGVEKRKKRCLTLATLIILLLFWSISLLPFFVSMKSYL